MSVEPGRRRRVVWRGLDGWRAEACEVELAADRLQARGTQIGAEPLPYRLDYELETGAEWVTARLRVRVRGEAWSRELNLGHDGRGTWTIETTDHGSPRGLEPPGGDPATVQGALDCDLGLCPLTNTMPVLRSKVMESEAPPHDFLMTWVAVPALSVHPSEQRYEHVARRPDGSSTVRYVGRHRDFVGELEFDADALVEHYPELAERVA